MKRKKIAAFVVAGALCAALAAGSTVAYLTDKEDLTNQFTVGKVDIEGEEPNYTPDPDGKTNDIVPTEEIAKDPQIENVGKNDAYVYMDVSIPIAKVITTDADGNRQNGGVAKDTELFTMNNVSKKWTLMYSRRVDNNMVYVYSYNEILAPGKTTDPLFTSVTFANVVEGQIDEDQFDVPVNFYAIQALNTGDGTSVPEQAADAWQKYVNQNDGQAGDVVVQSDEGMTEEAGSADEGTTEEAGSAEEGTTEDPSAGEETDTGNEAEPEVDEGIEDEAGLA